MIDRQTGHDLLLDLNDDYPSRAVHGESRLLRPKQFVPPDDALGNKMGLTSVCVTSADAVESATQPKVKSTDYSLDSVDGNEFSTVVDNKSFDSDEQPPKACQMVLTGAKRRKQSFSCNGMSEAHETIYTSSMSPEEKSSQNRPQSTSDSLNVDSSEKCPSSGTDCHSSTQESSPALSKKQAKARLKARFSRLNDDPTAHFRRLDCQLKLLHIAWHPKMLKLASVSENQLFIVQGLVSSTGDKMNFRERNTCDITPAKRRRYALHNGSTNHTVDRSVRLKSPTNGDAELLSKSVVMVDTGSGDPRTSLVADGAND